MNTNEQTIHQMGLGISSLVKQATGRESVSNIDMDWVSVEQLARYIYGSGSGDVVTFNTNIPDAIESLIAYITAVQDLHGYDNPWPAGGGKNLFEAKMPTSTQSDVTCTNNGDGSFTFTGTASADVTFRLDQGSRVGSDNLKNYKAGTYYVSGLNGKIFVLQKTGELIASLNGDGSFTLAEEKTEVYCYIKIASGIDSAGTVKPMIELGEEATDWVPYENICPITGWTGCTVTDANMLDSSDPDYHAETYSFTFPDEAGTVYGGTLDVLTGVLTVTDANIASYNGETLPSTWISDRDVYSVGTTPTTGAQVVYKLSTPLTYQLTAQEVTALIGANNIFADTGNVSVQYKVKEDLV